jgi:hypothetical protein
VDGEALSTSGSRLLAVGADDASDPASADLHKKGSRPDADGLRHLGNYMSVHFDAAASNEPPGL